MTTGRRLAADIYAHSYAASLQQTPQIWGHERPTSGSNGDRRAPIAETLHGKIALEEHFYLPSYEAYGADGEALDGAAVAPSREDRPHPHSEPAAS
jgi:hypothetical protein